MKFKKELKKKIKIIVSMLKFYTNKITTMLITIILNKINYYTQSLWNAAAAIANYNYAQYYLFWL